MGRSSVTREKSACPCDLRMNFFSLPVKSKTIPFSFIHGYPRTILLPANEVTDRRIGRFRSRTVILSSTYAEIEVLVFELSKRIRGKD